MLKRVFLILSMIFSSSSFAVDNSWFVGGSTGFNVNLSPTNINLGINFDFGYQWKEWRAFGEVVLSGSGSGLKGGMDYLMYLTKKEYLYVGFITGVVDQLNIFSLGTQFGYNYYILPDLTIGGGVRAEYLVGSSTDITSNANISGLFTVAYHIPK